MKTFKEFLEESSLSRIKSKSDKGGMAVISGSPVSYTHLTLPTICSV